MVERIFVEDYQPRSELVVPEHPVPRAKYPAIDAHNHLPIDRLLAQEVDLGQLVREMDMLNVQAIVNLSGGFGDLLKRNIEGLDAAYPGRFYTFCNVDWADVGASGWADRACAQIAADAAAGARGLKIFKRLGLQIRDTQDDLVMPDDPRIADIWDQAGALDIPVLIHVADPRAFFRPLDRLNERWDELHHRPEWLFYGPEYPAFEQLIEALYHLVESHPGTNFITAHVGCYPENLGFVARMMDRYPNLYTDISARIAELGRAPYSARDWFLSYPERILFGTDQSPRVSMYQTHFRFLETADEYFDYQAGAAIPPQGRWKIYGLFLPDEVLRSVYHENAQRLLGLS
jgi:predicted TIM-barrel fold metal-dependent hydrolase